jgi:hypothetical protein
VILLDTNVVSEVMRPKPDQNVIDWLTRFDSELALPAIAIAEIAHGIERIRPAERAPRLARTLDGLRKHYEGRVLAFDERAAMIYGVIMGDASRKGQNLGPLDGMIAATAVRHRAALATRNTRDFGFLELRVIDPWDGKMN